MVQYIKEKNMLYKVEAKFHKEKMAEFFTALTDDSIFKQEPDGSTMVKAMQTAIMIEDNTLVWYEHCFCSTPLKHERETVYDKYFYDFKTILVDEVKDDIVGDYFWEYLKEA